MADNIFWRFTSFRAIGTYCCDVLCYNLTYRPHDKKDFASQILKNYKLVGLGTYYISRVVAVFTVGTVLPTLQIVIDTLLEIMLTTHLVGTSLVYNRDNTTSQDEISNIFPM